VCLLVCGGLVCVCLFVEGWCVFSCLWRVGVLLQCGAVWRCALCRLCCCAVAGACSVCTYRFSHVTIPSLRDMCGDFCVCVVCMACVVTSVCVLCVWHLFMMKLAVHELCVWCGVVCVVWLCGVCCVVLVVCGACVCVLVCGACVCACVCGACVCVLVCVCLCVVLMLVECGACGISVCVCSKVRLRLFMLAAMVGASVGFVSQGVVFVVLLVCCVVLWCGVVWCGVVRCADNLCCLLMNLTGDQLLRTCLEQLRDVPKQMTSQDRVCVPTNTHRLCVCCTLKVQICFAGTV